MARAQLDPKARTDPPEALRNGGVRARAAHLGPERRRPLVLDAAFELFLERGYEGTSMEAIAEALGVTKPVLYACYPSKEDLFNALLQREERRVMESIAEAFPADADLQDPEPVLIEALTGFLRAVAESPKAYRVIFLGEGGGNAAVARRVERGRREQVAAIASLARVWLERREPALGIDLDSAALLIGRGVVAVAEAGARTLLAGEGDWTPETLGAALGRLASRGQAAL
jgi:AcrR family transcriptional regulator